MNIWTLWMRWSWRDLRHRWTQVATIALIIALGTGTYSGLVSTSAWRLQANDASYALLNMYDLRLSLTEGSYLNQSDVLNAVRSIDHAEWITAASPRLIIRTLVDASTTSQTIMVPGRLIGMPVAGSEPLVNALSVTAGRGFGADDAGQSVAVLEHKFAAYYGLPAQGKIRLSGDHVLEYRGTGLSPEYFIIFTDEGGMMAEANFAVVFVSLETAQALVDRQGMVNDILFTLAADADPALVRSELEAAVKKVAPVGISFMVPEDDPTYRMLYEDIETDEWFWRWMAYLFIAAAVFGAFNLATRLVESQRREIGIQMALGLPPYLIALRPLLVAIQIAVLGVILGLVIGVFLGNDFGDLILRMMPLPVFEMPFQPRVFAEAALLGIVLPFVATLIPVIRALRVEPVDAIRTGHLIAKGGGWTPAWAYRLVTARVLTQMPFRNVLRAPRRALLTLLGITAAVMLLVLIMGMLDSFNMTLQQARDELLQASPERMVVQLNFFYPSSSTVVTGIAQSPALGAAEPSLELGSYLIHDGNRIETLLSMVNLQSALWRPTVVAGVYPASDPGLLLSAKAAADLGVQPGDTITLRHPRRTGLLSYDWVETGIMVSGIHELPLRFQTYMDINQAAMMGLSGLVNALQVNPAAGVSQDEVKRALFNQTGVASVQPVATVIRVFEDIIGEFVSIFSLMQVAAVALAILIAYNSTSISLDERAREIATLFAFGVRLRTALRVAVVENLVISLLGSVLGCLLGYVFLVLLLTSMLYEVMPDIQMTIRVHGLTLMVVMLVGVLVAVLTPVLNVRKMLRMDIPSTLRVME